MSLKTRTFNRCEIIRQSDKCILYIKVGNYIFFAPANFIIIRLFRLFAELFLLGEFECIYVLFDVLCKAKYFFLSKFVFKIEWNLGSQI